MSRTKKLILRVSLIVLAVLAAILLAMTFYVESDVQKVCDSAVKRYPGDKIDAIILVAQESDLCTKEKTRALWALGQLGDKKVLPFLRANYAGKSEDNICIYEAQFAIEKLEKGSFNLPGFLWRRLLSN